MENSNIETENKQINNYYKKLIFSLFVISELIKFISKFTFSNSEITARGVYSTSMFIFLALVIWKERENLNEFGFDKFSLGLFLFINPVFGLIYPTIIKNLYSYYILAGFIVVLSSVLIANILYKKIVEESSLKVSNYKWHIIGGIGAILLFFLVNYSVFSGTVTNSTNYDISFWSIIILGIFNSVYQISFTVNFEEIIFRGFLWGYYRKEGWSEIKIWISISIFFWLIHLNGENYFLLGYPVVSFFFGYLVMKSKSIGASIIAHGIYNSLNYIPIAALISLFP